MNATASLSTSNIFVVSHMGAIIKRVTANRIANTDDKESNNIRAGFGADIETMSKWSYQLDYEMNHRLDSSHMDTLSAAAFYELELDTIISLSLDSEEFSNSAVKLELKQLNSRLAKK